METYTTSMEVNSICHGSTYVSLEADESFHESSGKVLGVYLFTDMDGGSGFPLPWE